jgi:high affinity Mn2+ porin
MAETSPARQRRPRLLPGITLSLIALAVAATSAGGASSANTAESADAPQGSAPPDAPGAASPLPMLLGLQYTFIDQRQTELLSPYQSHLSLLPQGDQQSTNTIGAYGGWAPLSWAQAYLDIEKFMGAGVSGATGIAGLTNGDVVREGTSGLKKEFYIARLYARFMVPLAPETVAVERAEDQIPGREAARRLEFKVGLMSVADDFDKNRYAGSARGEFMNWSLWQNTAWDYAANTRGYTDGLVLGYISPQWSLKYGMYRMPVVANGQTLETLARAREQDLELTLSPAGIGTIVRLLGYYNVGNMGIYSQALAIAAESGTVPNIAADNQGGRKKLGFGVNLEQPLADDGGSGLFMRLGWNDGKTEDFVFTEVDRVVSFGGQLAGVHWSRAEDRVGAGVVVEGISASHRDYLAAGGMGFLLGDGHLNYGYEQILETYYRAQWQWSVAHAPLRLQLTPDFQYMQNPGYNRDRGPVRFYALRLHLEY